MLAYLLIKPEAYLFLPRVINAIQSYPDPSEEEKKLLTTIKNGLEILRNPANVKAEDELLYVATGIMTDDLLQILYNMDELPEDRRRLLRDSLVDSPYGVIFFEIDEKSYSDPLLLLQRIKGKIVSAENPEGTGLRGLIRREYGGLPENKARNFVHIPDTEIEMINALSYFLKNRRDPQFSSEGTKSDREFKTLFCNKKRIQEIKEEKREGKVQEGEDTLI
ncbi:MAG: hypothetical protein K6343_06005 [Caldisericaceae bacterium]